MKSINALMRSSPNLLDDRLVPTRLGSTLLMVGLACSALAAWHWSEAQSAVDRARLDLEAAQMLATDVRAPVVAPVGSAQRKAALASATSLNPARSSEADQQALQQFLQIDWNRRLHQMEQASSGRIALLGMKLDTQKSTAELRGAVQGLRPFVCSATKSFVIQALPGRCSPLQWSGPNESRFDCHGMVRSVGSGGAPCACCDVGDQA